MSRLQERRQVNRAPDLARHRYVRGDRFFNPWPFHKITQLKPITALPFRIWPGAKVAQAFAAGLVKCRTKGLTVTLPQRAFVAVVIT